MSICLLRREPQIALYESRIILASMARLGVHVQYGIGEILDLIMGRAGAEVNHCPRFLLWAERDERRLMLPCDAI